MNTVKAVVDGRLGVFRESGISAIFSGVERRWGVGALDSGRYSERDNRRQRLIIDEAHSVGFASQDHRVQLHDRSWTVLVVWR